MGNNVLQERISSIITDIEGTTTPLTFVRDVLFPYARPRLRPWLREHAQSQTASSVLVQVQQEVGQPLSLEQAISRLEQWSDEDRKIGVLKTLQGLIWEAGYADGSLVAPVYPDVLPALTAWHAAGITLGVYSSGSVAAQHLLFGHTNEGDLRPLFSHWFDTETGAKQAVGSYQRIASQLGHPPSTLLFLSDHSAEVAAALAAGWHALLITRNDAALPAPPLPGQTPVDSFAGIRIDTPVTLHLAG